MPIKMTGYFYTTEILKEGQQLQLFVDGEFKGALPYINMDHSKLTKIDSTIKATTLKLDFMSGRHLVQAKKLDGTMVSSSEMYFEFYKNKTKSGVEGNLGSSGFIRFDPKNEVVIWLASKL